MPSRWEVSPQIQIDDSPAADKTSRGYSGSNFRASSHLQGVGTLAAAVRADLIYITPYAIGSIG